MNIQSLDFDDEPTFVVLQDANKQQVKILRDHTTLSGFITTVLSECGDSNEVSLPVIETDGILTLIADYLTRHKGVVPKPIKKPLVTTDLSYSVDDEWDVNFIDKELNVIKELACVANYLSIEPLVELCCAKLATLIKGKDASTFKEALDL